MIPISTTIGTLRMRRGASANSSKAQTVGSHLCMHKAYRLVARGESAICASDLLVLHQSYAADPKRAINFK